MSDDIEQLKTEYEAFRESSTQLEQELEAEIARVDELWRVSEEKRRHIEEDSLRMKTDLMDQLKESHQELINLRQEKSSMMKTIRNQEEALEQMTQSERRVKAEVEFLRRDLDESMETVAFAQTELEDLQRTSEETNEKLRQELEEVKAKLALVTQGKEEGATISVGSPGRGIDGRREEDLMGPLRLWSPRAPFDGNDSILESTKRCGSVTDLTSVCSSRYTPGSGRAYSLPIHDPLYERPVSSGTEASVVMARMSAGFNLTGGHEGEILSRSCEDIIDVSENESSSSSDKAVECCFLPNFVPDTIRALSQWRPFAWCEPR